MSNDPRPVQLALTLAEAKTLIGALWGYQERLLDNPPKPLAEMDTPEERRRYAENNAHELVRARSLAETVMRAREAARRELAEATP